MRKILNPMFSNCELTKFVSVMDTKAKTCVDVLEETISNNSDGEPINIASLIAHLTFDVLGSK